MYIKRLSVFPCFFIFLVRNDIRERVTDSATCHSSAHHGPFCPFRCKVTCGTSRPICLVIGSKSQLYKINWSSCLCLYNFDCFLSFDCFSLTSLSTGPCGCLNFILQFYKSTVQFIFKVGQDKNLLQNFTLIFDAYFYFFVN